MTLFIIFHSLASHAHHLCDNSAENTVLRSLPANKQHFKRLIQIRTSRRSADARKEATARVRFGGRTCFLRHCTDTMYQIESETRPQPAPKCSCMQATRSTRTKLWTGIWRKSSRHDCRLPKQNAYECPGAQGPPPTEERDRDEPSLKSHPHSHPLSLHHSK